MGQVTLQVLDGSDRGKVYRNLVTPVTIGREEGNVVQLNDERISRYHAKIQEDQGQLVLTDLESTNGTRVNGQPIQLSILRVGDRIAVGRSLLLLGSPRQIEHEIDATPDDPSTASRTPDSSLLHNTRAVPAPSDLVHDGTVAHDLSFELNFGDPSEASPSISPSSESGRPHPPDPPVKLSPAQAAQLSELLLHLHQELNRATAEVSPNGDDGGVDLSRSGWQRILRVQMELARYLYRIGRGE